MYEYVKLQINISLSLSLHPFISPSKNQQIQKM